MRKIAFALTLAAAVLAAWPALAVRSWSDCPEAYRFPDGFGVAAFGMSEADLKGLARCGVTMLGDEEGAYSAAGKIDKIDVIYEFTVTPKAKKLFKLSLETLSKELYDDIRQEVVRQLGQPIPDAKGRDTWDDTKTGANIQMFRSKAYYKVQVKNPSYLLEEAMGYFCDAAYALPAGYGPFKFGTAPEDVVKVLGCGYRFVSKTDLRITLQGYAFNQPAEVTLEFAGGTLSAVVLAIAKADIFPLVESVLTDKFGKPSAAGAGRLWQVQGATVTLDRDTGLRVRFQAPGQ